MSAMAWARNACNSATRRAGDLSCVEGAPALLDELAKRLLLSVVGADCAEAVLVAAFEVASLSDTELAENPGRSSMERMRAGDAGVPSSEVAAAAVGERK